MEILRYGASGASAWKILRGGRVLRDILDILLLLTHVGYPIVVYHRQRIKNVLDFTLPDRELNVCKENLVNKRLIDYSILTNFQNTLALRKL